MNEKRVKGLVTMSGKEVTLIGRQLEEGDALPRFKALKTDLTTFDSCQACERDICMLLAVPSLDTSVCSGEARRFDKEVERLGGKAKAFVISMDLPFAQERWGKEAGVRNLTLLSDSRDADFGHKYGVLIEEYRLLARAVFISDADQRIRYIQLVPDTSQEPDYDKAISAAQRLM